MSTPNVNPYTVERGNVAGNGTRDDDYIEQRREIKEPMIGGVADEEVMKTGNPFEFFLARIAGEGEEEVVPETEASHALGFTALNRIGQKGWTEHDFWQRHRSVGVLKGNLRGNDGEEANAQFNAGLILRGLTNCHHIGPNPVLPFRFLRLRVPTTDVEAEQLANIIHDNNSIKPSGRILPYLEVVDMEKIGFSKKWVDEMREEHEASIDPEHASGHRPIWSEHNRQIWDRMISAQQMLTMATLTYLTDRVSNNNFDDLLKEHGLEGQQVKNVLAFAVHLFGDLFGLTGGDAGGKINIEQLRMQAMLATVQAIAPHERDFASVDTDFKFDKTTADCLRHCRRGARQWGYMMQRLRYINLRPVVGRSLSYAEGGEGQTVEFLYDHFGL